MVPRERSRSCPANFCRAGFLRAEEPDDTNLIDFCGPGRGPGRVRWIIVDRPWRWESFNSIMPPTGQGKQIETYLCAHVAVLCMGDRLISASLALGCRVASEPMAMPVAWCLVVVVVARSHWRTHVLVLARSIGFRRRALPIAEDFSACLLCSRAVSGVDNGFWYGWCAGVADCNCHLGWAVGASPLLQLQ